METVYDKAQKLNSKNFKLLIGVKIMSVPYRNRRKRFELRAELICAIINYEVN
ncbi:hypothetical protein [Streptococcus pneumoniae]|uniref:hypothetical protein n=1 Tax=Streptococcus pneumoniae TaxID=1313 RepID=UPI0010241185|nr:transposase (IS4 family) [Streptococcus pneumoniae]